MPALDGVIAPGEYGVRVDGQDQKLASGSSTTWCLTWTSTHPYVAITDANVDEGLVLHVATPGSDTKPFAIVGP